MVLNIYLLFEKSALGHKGCGRRGEGKEGERGIQKVREVKDKTG